MGTFNCGHPHTPENSRPSGRGTRCKRCDADYHAKHRAWLDCKCGTRIELRNKSGKCQACYTASLPKCACGMPLSQNNIHGVCWRCTTREQRKKANCTSCNKAIQPSASGFCIDCYRKNVRAIPAPRWPDDAFVVVTGADLPAIAGLNRFIGPAQRVLHRAAQVFGATVDEIKGPSRTRRTVLPRVAIARVLRNHGWSTPQIANLLGRSDHTTTRHWLAVADIHANKAPFREALRELERAYALRLPKAMAA